MVYAERERERESRVETMLASYVIVSSDALWNCMAISMVSVTPASSGKNGHEVTAGLSASPHEYHMLFRAKFKAKAD